MTDPGCDKLIDGFSFGEKIIFRTVYFGMLAVGVWGIATVSPFWAWTYAAVATVCNLGVMRGLCAHCPYPYKRSDCLFFPHFLLTALFRYRGPRFSKFDKTLMAVCGGVLTAMPLVWLWRAPVFLTLYLALAAVIYLSFARHYCKHCRNVGCPINKVPTGLRKECLRDIGNAD